MGKIAVIKTGGKQYLVKEGEEVYVEKLPFQKGDEIELETLAIYDNESKKEEIGQPILKKKVLAEVIEQVKGNKIRIRRFKAKVRYRRVKGHRQFLTKIKIKKID